MKCIIRNFGINQEKIGLYVDIIFVLYKYLYFVNIMDIQKNFINIPLNGDRLGGQLTYNLAYLFYAYFYNLPIKYQSKGNQFF